MQVKITQRIITGNLANSYIGQITTVSDEFGAHLIEIGAGELYETKVSEDYEPVKKPPSSPSLVEAQASPKKTAKKRKSTRKS